MERQLKGDSREQEGRRRHIEKHSQGRSLEAAEQEGETRATEGRGQTNWLRTRLLWHPYTEESTPVCVHVLMCTRAGLHTLRLAGTKKSKMLGTSLFPHSSKGDIPAFLPLVCLEGVSRLLPENPCFVSCHVLLGSAP